jgi:hypothetical protein
MRREATRRELEPDEIEEAYDRAKRAILRPADAEAA